MANKKKNDKSGIGPLDYTFTVPEDTTIDWSKVKIDTSSTAGSWSSSGTISTKDTLSDWWTYSYTPEKAICSKCKKEEEVHTHYNWSDDDKLKRTICKKCHTTAMDKLYGLDNNIKTEEVLYAKKKESEGHKTD